MKIFLVAASALTFALSTVAEKAQFLTDDFIQAINEKQTTWVAGRNFPEGTPLEQLRRLNGARKDPENVRASRLKIHPRSFTIIPDTFDAREVWPFCESINSIRYQGMCGSCWAYAAVEVMSDRLCIATGGEVEFEYSPEDVLACCSDCGSCLGGFVNNAFDYWVNEGIVSGGDYFSNEGCQPYQLAAEAGDQAGVVCERKCLNDNYTTSYEDDKHYGSSVYYIGNDVEQIQIEIMTNGPVTAVFDVHDDFYSYRSGVYQYTFGNFTGGHAVKIIGWGVDDDTPYWLIANSWGDWWGELNGFFKFLRGQNQFNIEQFIWTGLPRKYQKFYNLL